MCRALWKTSEKFHHHCHPQFEECDDVKNGRPYKVGKNKYLDKNPDVCKVCEAEYRAGTLDIEVWQAYEAANALSQHVKVARAEADKVWNESRRIQEAMEGPSRSQVAYKELISAMQHSRSADAAMEKVVGRARVARARLDSLKARHESANAEFDRILNRYRECVEDRNIRDAGSVLMAAKAVPAEKLIGNSENDGTSSRWDLRPGLIDFATSQEVVSNSSLTANRNALLIRFGAFSTSRM